jgi:DNA-binding transcriptional ArsR family regulator
MVAGANLVEVAALVGDTARATMLNALMGGQSLTATELAYRANVSRATASGHLSRLVAARLLTVTRNRRFSDYRIASALVATMLESIKVVAAIDGPPRRQPRRRELSIAGQTDQFAIGTLRVNAPTHSFGFCGPKFVWQITHAGWKLLRGIERR